MIRALIMWLASPTYEVRMINTKTGKDIPGRCVYKGSYFKARKVYHKTKLKYGNVLRLQAVAVLEHRINTTKPSMIIVDAGSVEPDPYNDVVESGGLPEAQATGHICDTDGPMDWDRDRQCYTPTCSVCGEMA